MPRRGVGWPAAARPTVLDVRLGVHPDKTRFVMEVTDPIDFRVFTLPDPYRVVVDFPEMTWNDSANQTSGSAGSVLNFRYAPYKPGTMRLVLNVSGPVRVREVFVLPPRDGKQPQFVLDMEPVSPGVFASEMNKVRGTHIAEQPAGATYTLPVATGAAIAGRPVPVLPDPPMDPSQSPCRQAPAVIPPQMPPGFGPGATTTRHPPRPWRRSASYRCRRSGRVRVLTPGASSCWILGMAESIRALSA